MADVTLIGSGAIMRASSDILSRAGFTLRHAFDVDDGERSPIILGDTPGGYALAHEAVNSGRHVLISNPAALPVERLSLLFESRRRAQALFVWSDRRYHPGYRFSRGLVETDATWAPRFLRQETLTTEPATAGLLRWRVTESAALLQSLTSSTPMSVSARGTPSALRSTTDYLSLSLGFQNVDGFISVGLGEPVERRETLIAAADRKAIVDELNPSVPVRLLNDEPGASQMVPARWVSYAPPPHEELVRQQCLAFLEATAETALAQEEAQLWQRALGVLAAMERSLQTDSAMVPVAVAPDRSALRVIAGRFFSPFPSPAA